MKIITWNINSIRLRISLLQKLQQIQKADIICLQETKTEDKFFPVNYIQSIGFKHIVFSGEKSYNGVAILSKIPIEKYFSLNLYNDDKRHISATINNIEIHNFYVPAGGDEPDIKKNLKYKHKLCFVKLIKEWFVLNRRYDNNLILLGDFNIAPYEHDVWSSYQLRNVISHTDLERKALFDLQDSFNFIDSGRYFVSLKEKLYSWWSYRNKDWQRSNRGRRLDHIWVSQSLKSRLQSINSFSDTRNWVRTSDHVPFILNISI